MTELYKRSCRDLNEYKAMLANGNFDKGLFGTKSQAEFTMRLKQRISQLELTIDQHLLKLLERPATANKNFQVKRDPLQKFKSYNYNRKLLLLLTNQPKLQKRDPTRLRMSGTT